MNFYHTVVGLGIMFGTIPLGMVIIQRFTKDYIQDTYRQAKGGFWGGVAVNLLFANFVGLAVSVLIGWIVFFANLIGESVVN